MMPRHINKMSEANKLSSTKKRRRNGKSYLDSIDLVKERILDILNDSETTDIAHIVSILIKNFPEYKRKKQSSLEKLVAREVHQHEALKQMDGMDQIKILDSQYSSTKALNTESAIAEKRQKLISSLQGPSLDELGDIEKHKRKIEKVCFDPIRKFNIYKKLGLFPPMGVLIHGPVGVGKSTLAKAIATELNLPFISIKSSELISNMSGDTEKKIKKLFAHAKQFAPSVLFFDDIDSLLVNRETQNTVRGMDKRILCQFNSCMDCLLENKEEEVNPVLILAATSRLDQLDSSVRQANRLEKDIFLTIPDAKGRLDILKQLTSRLKVDFGGDLWDIARDTPGFVASDLQALCKEAASCAIEENEATPTRDFSIGKRHFELSISKVVPNAKREGFITVPKVTWASIGALDEVKKELNLSITDPLMYPEKYQRFGLSIGGGVLLYGPPGCGKTLVAKAVANQSQANFLSVKGPELMNKYVGESERGVRQLFSRARASAPCVVFFDEIDSLCPKRGGTDGESSGVQERVVNQLLTELDGVEERKQVFIIAATNRPDIIDPALLRPGRLEKSLYVPMPNVTGRYQILSTLTKNLPCESALKEGGLQQISESKDIEGFSGADLAALVKEASLLSIREDSCVLTTQHFVNALPLVTKSVKDLKQYKRTF
eukprot:maker-scaffold_11-snap-gene-2.30-mRNA-1 protein AED:0.02 eAED:0.02 QI:0/1/1/1/1/1/3/250/661